MVLVIIMLRSIPWFILSNFVQMYAGDKSTWQFLNCYRGIAFNNMQRSVFESQDKTIAVSLYV